jgi:hypothetical protein
LALVEDPKKGPYGYIRQSSSPLDIRNLNAADKTKETFTTPETFTTSSQFPNTAKMQFFTTVLALAVSAGFASAAPSPSNNLPDLTHLHETFEQALSQVEAAQAAKADDVSEVEKRQPGGTTCVFLGEEACYASVSVLIVVKEDSADIGPSASSKLDAVATVRPTMSAHASSAKLAKLLN